MIIYRQIVMKQNSTVTLYMWEEKLCGMCVYNMCKYINGVTYSRIWVYTFTACYLPKNTWLYYFFFNSYPSLCFKDSMAILAKN